MKKIKINPILNDLDNRGFDYVISKYNLTTGEVLGILEDYVSREHLDGRLSKYRTLLNQKKVLTSLKGSRFGLISDTHIGNKKARWDYIQAAYDFFYYNDADAVIHLGDLFDGVDISNNLKRDKARHCFEKQLKEFQLNYPKTLPTYLLLGNHDEWFRQFGFDLFEELPTKNSSMNVLDYGGYRIKLNRTLFYLSHPINNGYCVSNKGCKVILRGHSHYFEYNRQRSLFRLNTCSDTHPNPAGGDYELAGGFSLLSFPSKTICFENYSFYHDDIVKSLCLKL